MQVISLNTRWGIKMKLVNDMWFTGGKKCTLKAAWFIEHGRRVGRACFFAFDFCCCCLCTGKYNIGRENNIRPMLISLKFTPALLPSLIARYCQRRHGHLRWKNSPKQPQSGTFRLVGPCLLPFLCLPLFPHAPSFPTTEGFPMSAFSAPGSVPPLPCLQTLCLGQFLLCESSSS